MCCSNKLKKKKARDKQMCLQQQIKEDRSKGQDSEETQAIIVPRTIIFGNIDWIQIKALTD